MVSFFSRIICHLLQFRCFTLKGQPGLNGLSSCEIRGHNITQEINTVFSAIKPVLIKYDVIYEVIMGFSMGIVFIIQCIM